MYDINDIRAIFSYNLQQKKFVTLPSGVKTIEIAPACFLADEPTIFGEPNDDYIARELSWYESQSLNVNDIPGGPPAIWKKVATPGGVINSNYGWAIWSEKNGKQYESVLAELKKDTTSRRGVMIYTRPTMHVDQNAGGMQDFMCTNTVQYLVRDDALDVVVSMRSNDAYHGYRNDWAWQSKVQHRLASDLGVGVGNIYWFAGSLHFYESHFHHIDPEYHFL